MRDDVSTSQRVDSGRGRRRERKRPGGEDTNSVRTGAESGQVLLDTNGCWSVVGVRSELLIDEGLRTRGGGKQT